MKMKVVALVKGSLSMASCQFFIKILMSYKQNTTKWGIQETSGTRVRCGNFSDENQSCSPCQG